MNDVANEKARSWPDRLGVVASAACGIHCLLVAAAPFLLASAGLALLISEEAEWAFVLSAVICGGVALALGLRRHHRWSVASLMAAGIVSLLLVRAFETPGLGPALSILASSLMIGGHLMNTRAMRQTSQAR